MAEKINDEEFLYPSSGSNSPTLVVDDSSSVEIPRQPLIHVKLEHQLCNSFNPNGNGVMRQNDVYAEPIPGPSHRAPAPPPQTFHVGHDRRPPPFFHRNMHGAPGPFGHPQNLRPWWQNGCYCDCHLRCSFLYPKDGPKKPLCACYKALKHQLVLYHEEVSYNQPIVNVDVKTPPAQYMCMVQEAIAHWKETEDYKRYFEELSRFVDMYLDNKVKVNTGPTFAPASALYPPVLEPNLNFPQGPPNPGQFVNHEMPHLEPQWGPGFPIREKICFCAHIHGPFKIIPCPLYNNPKNMNFYA